MPPYSAPNTKAEHLDRLRLQVAHLRAQCLFQNVALRDAAGDHFSADRFEFVRLLKMAMGVDQDRAGDLIEDALGGDPVAIDGVLGHLRRIIFDAG